MLKYHQCIFVKILFASKLHDSVVCTLALILGYFVVYARSLVKSGMCLPSTFHAAPVTTPACCLEMLFGGS